MEGRKGIGRARDLPLWGCGLPGALARAAVALAVVPTVLLAQAPAAENASAPAGGGREVRALLDPVHQATLTSEIGARISRLPLRQGERFKKGDSLVEFDCSLFLAQEGSAKAAQEAAKKTLENNKKLAALHSIGKLDVELSKAQLDKAEADLKAAKVPVSRCKLVAPFDGRVVDLRVHEHEGVTVGQPLVEILDDSHLEMVVLLPSRWLPKLQINQAFEIAVDETGKRYPAKITKIGSRVDPVSQSVKIWGEITGDTAGLVAGMSGSASFPGLGQ